MKKILIIFMIFLLLTNSFFAEKKKQANKKDSKSPTKALIMGVLVPGSGDFYNKKYVKGSIFFGLGLFFAYKSYNYYNKQKEYYDDYLETESREKYRLYEKNYDNMEKYMYFYLLNLTISTIDGVVESYLSDWHIEKIDVKSEYKNNKVSLFISREL